ncbi:MAG: hypothetical protein IJ291_04350 [Lachnospiraceae bacterium]|nr:hypothetical protein [Lachnospiraceae bacterium]
MSKKCSQGEKQLLYENRNHIIYSFGLRKLKRADYCNEDITIDWATIVDVDANSQKGSVYGL